MTRLHGRTAVITGAASGMGEATARLFVEHGARVVVADVSEDAGRAVASALGDAAMFRLLDVREPAAWDALRDATLDRFGSIDVLVNNAGVISWGGVSATTEDDFRRTMDVNCLGAFLGMQAVVPTMIEAGKGSIINVCSTSALVGSPRSIAYTASKWAARGMTKAAAIELAPMGIRVNAIHPGVIETPMNQAARVSSSGDRTSGLPPLGRRGEPAEVARLALYLASDDSSFTTGADHTIDGGRSAGW